MEIYKLIFKMLIRINILEIKMFFSNKDSVNYVLVRKVITLR